MTPIPGPAGQSQTQALIRGHLHLKTRLGQGQEGLTPTPYPVGLSRARALNRGNPFLGTRFGQDKTVLPGRGDPDPGLRQPRSP